MFFIEVCILLHFYDKKKVEDPEEVEVSHQRMTDYTGTSGLYSLDI